MATSNNWKAILVRRCTAAITIHHFYFVSTDEASLRSILSLFRWHVINQREESAVNKPHYLRLINRIFFERCVLLSIFACQEIENMFIHEIENWTSFKWNVNQLSDLTAKTNRAVGFLAGRLSTIGFNSQMHATVEAVTHDVVSSSEIEGISLNTAEVRSSVARKLGVTVPDMKEPTHYVDGIVEMMLDAVMNYNTPLTHERLFGWHAALFPSGKSGYSDITVGSYRKEAMEVVSGMFGRERIHYRAPEPERVYGEMDNFLHWFNDKNITPSFIKSAIAHLWFVCIHPFDDGNGRIARAVSDMVLSQVDCSKLRFFSMSMQINREKKEYYRILERTQRGDTDITEWLEWYLHCLGQAVEESNTLLSGILNKATFWRTHSETALTERQKNTLNIYLDGYEGKLTAKNWSKLAKVSLDTAGRDLKSLTAKGVVSPVQGRVRDVSYTLNYIRPHYRTRDFTDSALIRQKEGSYISTLFKGHKRMEERISGMDEVRFEQGELSLDDLIYKYFAYLME